MSGTHFVTSAVDGACGFQSQPSLDIRAHRVKARCRRPHPLPGPPPQGQARGEVTLLLLTPQHRPLPRSPSVLGTKAPAHQRPRRWRQEPLRNHLRRGDKQAGLAATMLQTLPGWGQSDRQEESSPGLLQGSPPPGNPRRPPLPGQLQSPASGWRYAAVPGKGQADSDSQWLWVTRSSSP